ncbi:MAG: tRNA 4-thiouridine(8) synthase ThiI [Bacilli bacterium]|nr:tRNA 4-thiouridine(8) synthase ThiI [Bacilli bacterium]
MNDSYLLVRFGELSTKGANRHVFVSRLGRNIRHALKEFQVEVTSDRDHIFISYLPEQFPSVVKRLQDVSGIQRISLVHVLPKDIEVIKEKALELLLQEPGKTFKVEAKRPDKHFELDSYGICRAIGGYILSHVGDRYSVDVHEPDVTIHCEIHETKAYLSCHDYPALGGYPLGMNGKALLLLSGGIDSPVAAYRLLRRGIKIECIHFAAPPYTSVAVIDKLEDILGKLDPYQEGIVLDVVPFTKLQEAIYEHVPEPYCITIMRRMMLRIATAVAKKNHALCLATGEAIGQVASQTLDSVQVINEVTNYPILRPLATEDKLSIIEESKKIGTYEISIRPYEDCCTIFKPKRPKTKPKAEECAYYESKWDFTSMVEECIENIERSYYKNGEKIIFDEEENKDE